MFLVFSDYFDVLVGVKIIFLKIKNIILIYFKIKNNLKIIYYPENNSWKQNKKQGVAGWVLA